MNIQLDEFLQETNQKVLNYEVAEAPDWPLDLFSGDSH